MNRLVILVILVLLTAPPANAGWFDDQLVLETAPIREGDALRYEGETKHVYLNTNVGDSRSTLQVVEQTSFVRFEGWNVTKDAVGEPRRVMSVLHERIEHDDLALAERCHVEPQGWTTIRSDVLAEDRSTGRTIMHEGEDAYRSIRLVTDYEGPCGMPQISWRTSFEEGERLRLPEILAGDVVDITSAPAESTTFAGRPALVYRFEHEGEARHESSGCGSWWRKACPASLS